MGWGPHHAIATPCTRHQYQTSYEHKKRKKRKQKERKNSNFFSSPSGDRVPFHRGPPQLRRGTRFWQAFVPRTSIGQSPKRPMEQENYHGRELSAMDALNKSNSVSSSQKSRRYSLDFSDQKNFRTVSLDRADNAVPLQFGSLNVCSTQPRLIVEGLPSRTSSVGRSDHVVGIGIPVRHDSLSRTSSRSSWGRHSISLRIDGEERTIDADELPQELMSKIDSSLAQVGCRGSRVGTDEEDDDGAFVTFSDDALVLSFGSRLNEPSLPTVASPLAEEIASPLPTDAILSSNEKKDQLSASLDKNEKLPPYLDKISYLIHLAVFGILGVWIRYLLQKLFGPDGIALTGGDHNALFLDLISNVLGSFLMGWIGFVFKADIHLVSDHLLVGLSTGFLGSLTTFSGWNQEVIELSSKAHWVHAIAGILLGIAFLQPAVSYGVGCASFVRQSILNWFENSPKRRRLRWRLGRMNTYHKKTFMMAVMLLVLCLLWILSGIFFKRKLDDLDKGGNLWLAFFAGPPGVWIRWRLARLNGQGIGRDRMLKWFPIGTWLANVSAACIMAALATVSKEVDTKKCTIIVSGLQLGFLGCLSTVSTFAAEVYGMWKSGYNWRAIVYISSTTIPSFALGTLIYSVPVWTNHYR